jgi:hypothetical protein
MGSFAEMFVGAVVLSTIVTHGWNRLFAEVASVKSAIDGREYIVKDTIDKQDAADRLAAINAVLLEFIDVLERDHPDDPRVKRLKRRYNPDNVSEGIPKTGYTSYSVNKGERLVVCIRQKDGQFVPQNEVLYVVIHELAHLATDEIGHTPEFWTNFHFLLHEAIDQNVYKYTNYAVYPAPYCGITISSTVLN